MSRRLRDVRVPCKRCGNWLWAGDWHTCPVPGPTNADVLAAAFPPHGLMVLAAARRSGRSPTWYARRFGHVGKGVL